MTDFFKLVFCVRNLLVTVLGFFFFIQLIIFCPVLRMKRANSLNVLNVGTRESQDGTQVSRLLVVQPIFVLHVLVVVVMVWWC